jgi:hypothetical protein
MRDREHRSKLGPLNLKVGRERSIVSSHRIQLLRSAIKPAVRPFNDQASFAAAIPEDRLKNAPSFDAGTQPKWGDRDYDKQLHDYVDD